MSDAGGATNPIIARIQRKAGIPALVDVLADRLDPTDVQSLLLAVFRRTAKVSADERANRAVQTAAAGVVQHFRCRSRPMRLLLD